MRPSPPSFDHLLATEHEHGLPHPIQVQIWRNGRSKYQRVRTAPVDAASRTPALTPAMAPAGATVHRETEALPPPGAA